MQHGGGDYASYYSATHYPPPPQSNQNSGEFLPPHNPIQPSYASAPPYSSDFQPAAYTSAPVGAAPPPHSYAPPPYIQNPEPSSYSHYPQQSQFPPFQTYNNPSPYTPEPPLPAAAGAYPPPVLQQGPLSGTAYPYDPSQRQIGKFDSPLNPAASPIPPSFDAPPYGMSSAGGFDHGAGYLADDSADKYARSRSSGSNWDFYEKPESEMRYDRFSAKEGLGNGAYPYDGGRTEPYGARRTVPTRSATLLDDYGRSLSLPSGGKDQGGSKGKILRAVPKVEEQQDVKNSVQKCRVKLLSEGGGQSSMDVLCQIGLDGIRMLDPSTSRTLRIYPLENVTRWEVTDSSIFTFWSKTSVDIEPRMIRLQSNSYTTSTILDTVTAATVQLKEMGGKESLLRGNGSSAGKQFEQPAEKKKGLIDWMNLIKPPIEDKDHWVPDEAVSKCTSCGSDFNAFNRRHHCRNCGDIFCDKCTQGRTALTADENAQPVRVCDACLAEVSQRLSSAKEASNKSAVIQSHEDLARKLQEEMDKKRKLSSGSKSSSNSSGRRMREVACPICTVHLQVQVPISGSETIECGVCQHPFLVSAAH